MTIAEQLAVLEEVAGVIDPDEYITHQHSKYDEGSPWWYQDRNDAARNIPMDIALATREHQAIKRIERWCTKHEASLSIVWARSAQPHCRYHISIDGQGNFFGPSLAHVLSTATKKLAETGETK